MDRILCKVNGEYALFHCWEHAIEPVWRGAPMGSPPVGHLGQVWGIVEFEDRTARIAPEEIHFCDHLNEQLHKLNKECEG